MGNEVTVVNKWEEPKPARYPFGAIYFCLSILLLFLLACVIVTANIAEDNAHPVSVQYTGLVVLSSAWEWKQFDTLATDYFGEKYYFDTEWVTPAGELPQIRRLHLHTSDLAFDAFPYGNRSIRRDPNWAAVAMSICSFTAMQIVIITMVLLPKPEGERDAK